METVVNQMLGWFGTNIPNFLAALAILIVGWLAALIIAAIVRGALRRTTLDNRLAVWIAGDQSKPIPIEQWIGTGVFYLILLFVLVAFFQTLGLTLITEPLNQLLIQIFEYAPRILGAAALLLIAWIIASVLRALVARVQSAVKLEERLGDKVGTNAERLPVGKTLSQVVFWLTLLLFLPAVLNALALEGLLTPVRGMVDEILGFLPNLFAAALILAVGWFVARIVQQIVANLLAAIGTDQMSQRSGLATALGKQQLSGLIGLIVYVLILVPVLIAALNALALDAITQPASNMLNQILGAFPLLFAAGLLIAIAFVVGRLLATLIANLLSGFGFDTVLTRLGLSKKPMEGKQFFSQVVGYVVLIAILLFAGIEAARLLGFTLLAEMLAQFTVFAGQILLGLIVFAIGLLLANYAAGAVSGSGMPQSNLLALAARLSIVILAVAMALRQMGLASDIINLAFGLLLGAIAVAVALAFGLGGREIAARELDAWLRTIRKEPERGYSAKTTPVKGVSPAE